jgi:hypothetical protein
VDNEGDLYYLMGNLEVDNFAAEEILLSKKFFFQARKLLGRKCLNKFGSLPYMANSRFLIVNQMSESK